MDLQRRQVFISYAPPDREIARQISERLEDKGVRAWFDEWEISHGDSLAEKIDAGIESSNLLLVLLSPEAVDSRWVKYEWTTALARELDYRAINVVPAIVRECVVPEPLADRQFLDLRENLDEGVDRLVSVLESSVAVGFDQLSAQHFEELVAELLEALGFQVHQSSPTADLGIDLLAERREQDPFGASFQGRWMVQVKRYRDTRVGVSFLQKTVGVLKSNSRLDNALIVTNGQLTSVAREFLETIEKDSRISIRVIEGTELRRLLLQHPEVSRKYFSSGGL